MFESLRYRWTSKEVKGVALAVALLTVVVMFALWRRLPAGAIVKGVVVSTGAVSVANACGATRQLASVQLADGGVVYAFVDFGGPLQPGTQVSLQRQSSWCDGVVYEVVAR